MKFTAPLNLTANRIHLPGESNSKIECATRQASAEKFPALLSPALTSAAQKACCLLAATFVALRLPVGSFAAFADLPDSPEDPEREAC